MTAITHHRRDLMIEADYLPASVADLAELRRQLVQMIASGECTEVKSSSANTTADSIVGWLVSKLDGADQLSPDTRSRYRRILGQLAEPDDDGGQRGSVTLAGAFLAMVGGLAPAALASGGRPVAMALAMASPIIYDESGYVGSGAVAA